MKTFDDVQKPIIELLDKFEMREYHTTAVHYISGGFAYADYDYIDNDLDEEDTQYVYFTLKWGVQSDCEDRVNTEHYKISVDDLLSEKTVLEKLDLIEEA
jgi:hypothetical protein